MIISGLVYTDEFIFMRTVCWMTLWITLIAPIFYNESKHMKNAWFSTKDFIFVHDRIWRCVYYLCRNKKCVFLMELDSEMSLSRCISGCCLCAEAAALKNSETERLRSHKSVHERNMPPSSPFSSLFCSSVPSVLAVGSISTISQTVDVNKCHVTVSGQSHMLQLKPC